MIHPHTLQFECTGHGEALVLVHGLGGSSNTFQSLMHRLGNFMVMRPDLPGCARSSTPEETLSIADMATSLLALLHAHGLSRFHLVGHSMGSLVAQCVAIHAPESVATLTMLGGITEPPQPARNGLLARAETARSKGMQGIADQIIAATLSPHTLEHVSTAVAFVRESVMRQHPEGYAKCCEAVAHHQGIDYRKIAAPTLLMTGDCDPVAPVSMAQQLCDAIPNAQLSVVHDCGHWLPVEQAKTCAMQLETFLLNHPI
jgi:3-oxoadipate enol-lactonase